MVVAASSIRLVQRAEGFRLETASQRLRLKDRTTGTQFFVSLVSTVHLADQQYFAGIQRECESFDRVLFELIADESLTQEVNGVRRLREPLRASEQQRQMARSLSLSPQIDVLDCTRSNWALADVPRAEVLQREISLGGSGPLASFRSALRTLGRGPASRANNALRPLSWVLPAPELALLLDDWTSSGGAPPAKVLQAIAGAAVSLDIDAARRLSFAQTLATGEATQRGSPAAALVSWRNERALQTVEEAVGSGNCRELALVYGALHMRGAKPTTLSPRPHHRRPCAPPQPLRLQPVVGHGALRVSLTVSHNPARSLPLTGRSPALARRHAGAAAAAFHSARGGGALVAYGVDGAHASCCRMGHTGMLSRFHRSL